MPVPFNDLKRHAAAMADELEAAALRVLRSGWFVLGPEVRAFEEEWAAACSAGHCVSLATGTDALVLALRALGVGPGDEVLTAANAGGYTACAARLLGALPTYADCDPATMLLDPAKAEAAITARTKAIVVVHLYGRAADLSPFLELSRRTGIPLVEDCAQAHGATFAGAPVGSHGAIGCFSFYPTKNLGALGDGGAVVTNDAALAERVRQLRTYGWAQKYSIALPEGTNSRLDELQAAFLRVKLGHLAAQTARRQEIAARYAAALGDCVTVPGDGESHVHHLYVVRVDPAQRDAVRAKLADAGIGTDVHYPIPDHRQPAWSADYAGLELPVADALAASVLSLPCYPELSDAEVDEVAAAVRAAVRA